MGVEPCPLRISQAPHGGFTPTHHDGATFGVSCSAGGDRSSRSSVLDTPDTVARFAVGLGYERDKVEAAVRKNFPDADVTSVVDAAFAHVAQRDAETEREIAEHQKATKADMDLGESMH
jgi:hypothetical protein